MSGYKILKATLAALLFLTTVVIAVESSTASTLERLVMPGEVISGHAKYEESCSKCHRLFKKGSQKKLCLDCHKKVKSDLSKKRGLHGLDKEVSGAECKHCHSEHKGRGADIIRLDREVFDHGKTDFPLKGGHKKLRCSTCHKEKKKYREAHSKCIACHKEDDTHKGRLGKDCAACHSQKNWSRARYDHKKTDFPLRGAHKKTECSSCHPNERYRKTPKDCYSCHLLNDVHRGRYRKKCKDCHNQNDWKKQKFDHDKVDYKLKYLHRKVECIACHTKPLYGKKKLGSKCFTCHKNNDEHKGRYGKKCESCHSERGWKKETFDHDKTDYKLRYKHKKVRCVACHRGAVYAKKKIGSECYACHKNDDTHKGQQGKTCKPCHNVRGWTKKVFFDHDLTDFPLVGLHSIASCEACHMSSKYKDTKSTCIACHKSEDKHKKKLGSECGSCHNPNGWRLWRFDHNTNTEYKLDGRHKDVDCLSCHRKPSGKKMRISKNCSGCHYEDDIHRGGFGLNCKRCHVTESFEKIKIK